ncbi:flavin reductase family protein [Streptomyces sp. NPDC047014]|uniref:flavin reductase family protein n=1 Tax=Streptomyces sp. NPDC047014 TaxID=3155736 RepID=UPI003403BA7A
MYTENPAGPPATRDIPHRRTGPKDPPSAPADGYGDPAAARGALRRLTSAVTVLTVDGGPGTRHGTTASSVVAVSREPLIIGVSLRPASVFTRLVLRAGTFSVNVLSAGQSALAKRFADPERPSGDAQFAGIAWARDPLSGAPLLHGSLAHMSCRVLERRRVGDHDLLLAEVTGGAPAREAPLLGFAGHLHAAKDMHPPR